MLRTRSHGHETATRQIGIGPEEVDELYCLGERRTKSSTISRRRSVAVQRKGLVKTVPNREFFAPKGSSQFLDSTRLLLCRRCRLQCLQAVDEHPGLFLRPPLEHIGRPPCPVALHGF